MIRFGTPIWIATKVLKMSDRATRPWAPFPEITLPVAPGRNLAVLVEAAARTHLLQDNDYNAAQDLIARQNRAIDDSTGGSN